MTLQKLKPLRLGPLLDARVADPTADMSGDEYLARAKARNAEQRAVSTSKLRPEREIVNNIVERAFAAIVCNEEYTKAIIDPSRDCLTLSDTPDGASEIVINNVHALPQRQRSIPPAGADRLGPSWPMRRQQDTGEWPTVATHKAGTTPVYEVFIDEWAQLHFEERQAARRQ